MGSRNKLGEDFVAALSEDWSEHGATVLAQVRQSSPVAYLRVVASMCPHHVSVTTDDQFSDMTDDELHETVEAMILEMGFVRPLAAAKPAVTPIARGQGATGSPGERIIVATNGDAKLRVFVEGTGPAFVMLPGQGRGPRDLETLAKHLASEGYRVIRSEPRGFGESVGPIEGVTLRDNAADIAAAIEATNAPPAIVGGWAYGNRVARMLATEFPQLRRIDRRRGKVCTQARSLPKFA
jgi:hypothetical protein